jgi:hypothetical protein
MGVGGLWNGTTVIGRVRQQTFHCTNASNDWRKTSDLFYEQTVDQHVIINPLLSHSRGNYSEQPSFHLAIFSISNSFS